jgi:hypothetical protein
MTKLRKPVWLTILGLVLLIPAAWAQQKDPRNLDPQTPYPPLSSLESNKASEESSSGVPAQSKLPAPDQRPLSGVEQLTLGLPDAGHSYLLPSFQFAQMGDTNAQSTAGRSQLRTASTVSTHFLLRRAWGRSELTADYGGGGVFYNTHSDLNATFHQLGFRQMITGRRWSLLLSDYASYLPQSPFGFGASGEVPAVSSGLGRGFEGSLPGLNPIFTPNQTILTARARRISNTFLGEIQYKASPRSSVTVSGAYGILHYLEAGFIDGDSAMFRTGYNRDVTAHDSIAVIYGFSMFRFKGISQGINNHVLQLAYGRRVTGRLAFQLAAGPVMSTFRNASGGSERPLSWNMESSLRYGFRSGDLALSYLRHMTGGSGVLIGAQTDETRLTLGRQLSRTFSGLLNLVYARNGALRQTTAGLLDRSFNSWGASVQLNRSLGGNNSMFFNYGVQREGSGTAFCAGSSCGTVLLRHYFSLGFSWQFHPIRIS